MSNQLILTQDGSHSIFSEQFGVPYHSKYGAIQETRHVFINAALLYKAMTQSTIHILDIGFGTGLNAYMSYLEAIRRKITLHYTAVEAYPIPQEQAAAINYPHLLGDTKTAAIYLQLHEADWNKPTLIDPQFQFTKLLQDFQSIDFQEQFDVLYFDAFAPNAQPELWETSLLRKMYDALKPKGVFVTYCAKGQVKRNLKSLGFKVEKLDGPPGKREMTRAIKE